MAFRFSFSFCFIQQFFKKMDAELLGAWGGVGKVRMEGSCEAFQHLLSMSGFSQSSQPPPVLFIPFHSFAQKPSAGVMKFKKSYFISNSYWLKSLIGITTYFGSLGYFLPLIRGMKILFYLLFFFFAIQQNQFFQLFPEYTPVKDFFFISV